MASRGEITRIGERDTDPRRASIPTRGEKKESGENPNDGRERPAFEATERISVASPLPGFACLDQERMAAPTRITAAGA